MGLTNFFKAIVTTVQQNMNFSSIIDAAHEEYRKKDTHHWWWIKPAESRVFEEQVLTLSDKQKVAFITTAVEKINNHNKGRNSFSSAEIGEQKVQIWTNFMQHLLKTKLVLDDDDITDILRAFYENKKFDWVQHLLYWPVSLLVNQVEKQLKDRPATAQLINALTELNGKLVEPAYAHQQKEQAKIVEKIKGIIFKYTAGDAAVKPTYFIVDDALYKYTREQVDAAPDKDKPYWFRLAMLAQKASGAKPSKKFLADAKTEFTGMGTDRFKKMVNDWFDFVAGYKEIEKVLVQTFHSREYRTTYYEFLAPPNLDVLKGFVWMCVHFHDKTTLNNIAALAERSYRKIPGKGPAAAGLGNACLYVLAKSKGLDGIAHLSRLKMRIKQNTTQNLIENYLQEAAVQQGVSVHEIEDMAVDEYGLVDGKAEFEFDGYKAVLLITGIGKTELQWFKPDGTQQKAVPAFVKEKYAAKLKKIKDNIGQIEATLTAQRDRLDRMLKSDRKLTWQQFNEFYFAHGLMSYIIKKLVWNIEYNGNTTALLFHNRQWVDNKGEAQEIDLTNATISLWHPVANTIETITAWRDLLLMHKIMQPLKQVFREVYLLTEAEINTRTYSNRMAAHILKQHQFNSLAKIRGWKYSLLGAYDDGRDNEAASINLPDYNLRAEYWINEVNSDDAFNDTGIWLYVATDQVRFINTVTEEVVELINVPALAFTEVMRDVDLFVGVASVGNDPVWRDSGGLPAYRDYWQTYSFGELTEVAKTRKAILERLVPRLKIASVASIKDKFLVVKGKLRTYKIHIGSTNILMEPNDQYLCIVPDRSGKSLTAENLFLPFEGDNGLSVILSKAMLLADDDKITDGSITMQINYK